jgi:hypothetical protein
MGYHPIYRPRLDEDPFKHESKLQADNSLVTFMPNSPRQLVRSGKIEGALRTFTRIRSDLHDQGVQEEFALMKAQIEFEMERRVPSYWEIFKLYRHRALV